MNGMYRETRLTVRRACFCTYHLTQVALALVEAVKDATIAGAFCGKAYKFCINCDVYMYKEEPRRIKGGLFEEKNKATEAALTDREKKLFLLRFLDWMLSIVSGRLFLVQSGIELVGDKDNATVFRALLVCPLVWFEVAFNGEQCPFGELVE